MPQFPPLPDGDSEPETLIDVYEALWDRKVLGPDLAIKSPGQDQGLALCRAGAQTPR